MKKSTIQSVENWSVKYRPTSLDEFCGQTTAVDQIRGFIKSKQLPKALIITGPTSSGKTTLSKIIGKTVNGGTIDNIPDYTEYNVGDQRSIDFVRSLTKNAHFMPQSSPLRFIVLDEVHQLVGPAASALLTPLEKVPAHAVYILCTDQPNKVLYQIRNRCMPINLTLLEPEEMLPMLKRVCAAENFKTKSVNLKKIAEMAGGQPRMALQLLQKLYAIVMGGEKSNIEEAIVGYLEQIGMEDGGKTAVLLLVSIYKDKPAVFMREMTTRFKQNYGIIDILLDLNQYLIETHYGARTYENPNRNMMGLALRKYKVEVDATKLFAVHEGLINLKQESTTYSNEKDLFYGYLGKFFQSKRG